MVCRCALVVFMPLDSCLILSIFLTAAKLCHFFQFLQICSAAFLLQQGPFPTSLVLCARSQHLLAVMTDYSTSTSPDVLTSDLAVHHADENTVPNLVSSATSTSSWADRAAPPRPEHGKFSFKSPVTSHVYPHSSNIEQSSALAVMASPAGGHAPSYSGLRNHLLKHMCVKQSAAAPVAAEPPPPTPNNQATTSGFHSEELRKYDAYDIANLSGMSSPPRVDASNSNNVSPNGNQTRDSSMPCPTLEEAYAALFPTAVSAGAATSPSSSRLSLGAAIINATTPSNGSVDGDFDPFASATTRTSNAAAGGSALSVEDPGARGDVRRLSMSIQSLHSVSSLGQQIRSRIFGLLAAAVRVSAPPSPSSSSASSPTASSSSSSTSAANSTWKIATDEEAECNGGSDSGTRASLSTASSSVVTVSRPALSSSLTSPSPKAVFAVVVPLLRTYTHVRQMAFALRAVAFRTATRLFIRIYQSSHQHRGTLALVARLLTPSARTMTTIAGTALGSEAAQMIMFVGAALALQCSRMWRSRPAHVAAAGVATLLLLRTLLSRRGNSAHASFALSSATHTSALSGMSGRLTAVDSSMGLSTNRNSLVVNLGPSTVLGGGTGTTMSLHMTSSPAAPLTTSVAALSTSTSAASSPSLMRVVLKFVWSLRHLVTVPLYLSFRCVGFTLGTTLRIVDFAARHHRLVLGAYGFLRTCKAFAPGLHALIMLELQQCVHLTHSTLLHAHARARALLLAVHTDLNLRYERVYAQYAITLKPHVDTVLLGARLVHAAGSAAYAVLRAGPTALEQQQHRLQGTGAVPMLQEASPATDGNSSANVASSHLIESSSRSDVAVLAAISSLHAEVAKAIATPRIVPVWAPHVGSTTATSTPMARGTFLRQSLSSTSSARQAQNLFFSPPAFASTAHAPAGTTTPANSSLYCISQQLSTSTSTSTVMSVPQSYPIPASLVSRTFSTRTASSMSATAATPCPMPSIQVPAPVSSAFYTIRETGALPSVADDSHLHTSTAQQSPAPPSCTAGSSLASLDSGCGEDDVASPMCLFNRPNRTSCSPSSATYSSYVPTSSCAAAAAVFARRVSIMPMSPDAADDVVPSSSADANCIAVGNVRASQPLTPLPVPLVQPPVSIVASSTATTAAAASENVAVAAVQGAITSSLAQLMMASPLRLSSDMNASVQQQQQRYHYSHDASEHQTKSTSTSSSPTLELLLEESVDAPMQTPHSNALSTSSSEGHAADAKPGSIDVANNTVAVSVTETPQQHSPSTSSANTSRFSISAFCRKARRSSIVCTGALSSTSSTSAVLGSSSIARFVMPISMSSTASTSSITCNKPRVMRPAPRIPLPTIPGTIAASSTAHKDPAASSAVSGNVLRASRRSSIMPRPVMLPSSSNSSITRTNQQAPPSTDVLFARGGRMSSVRRTTMWRRPEAAALGVASAAVVPSVTPSTASVVAVEQDDALNNKRCNESVPPSSSSNTTASATVDAAACAVEPGTDLATTVAATSYPTEPKNRKKSYWAFEEEDNADAATLSSFSVHAAPSLSSSSSSCTVNPHAVAQSAEDGSVSESDVATMLEQSGVRYSFLKVIEDVMQEDDEEQAGEDVAAAAAGVECENGNYTAPADVDALFHSPIRPDNDALVNNENVPVLSFDATATTPAQGKATISPVKHRVSTMTAAVSTPTGRRASSSAAGLLHDRSPFARLNI